MAVRPPQDDMDDGPDTVAFGIAALDSSLEEKDITFPTNEETLRTTLGDTEIPYDVAGNTMSVNTALDNVPEEQFEDRRELLNTLHPIFEERRESGGDSILSRIRSFIPL